MKILIPTCKPSSDVLHMMAQIQKLNSGVEVFASCHDASASVNRNICLDQIEVGETAIMLDDDIEGFYEGWIEDLVKGLEVPHACVVSARLLNPDGTFGPSCSRNQDPWPHEIEIKGNGICIIPTAAIAFVHRGHRFDENFKGSGFEDNDWMYQYLKADPQAVFIQSNRCRLIHRNEMKGQKGPNWDHNKQYFLKKWRVQ